MIENWKQAWKMLSIWVFTIAGTLAGLEQCLPALKDVIPPGTYAGLMILGIVARLIRQRSIGTPESTVEELKRVKAILRDAGKISIVLLCFGCGTSRPPEVPNDDEALCIAAEFVRKEQEKKDCGENTEGACSSKSIMQKSMERRHRCLEEN